MPVTVIVGSDKGAFLLRSNDKRNAWEIEGPLFKGWRVTSAARGPSGAYLLGLASEVYGPAIQKSTNLRDWHQVAESPTYEKDGDRKLKKIWKLVASGDIWYAGVDEAGMFRSDDDGETWTPLPGLNDHHTRKSWFPGNGGLCAHAILVDPKDPNRIWCGISAVGVFRSDDGGATFTPKNEGVPVIIEDKEFKDIGYCVHALVADPADGNRIYRQDHRGMFRTSDGGDHWECIEKGLPSGFGFPITMDRTSGALYCAPMESDEYRIPKDGQLRVYRSADRGDSWHALGKGLPDEHTYCGVLRGAMDVDHLSPCGVYFGTTSGDVFASNDGGDSWQTIPCRLPRVFTVSAFSDG